MTLRLISDHRDLNDYYGHVEVVDMTDQARDQGWSVADAKAHLSELLETVARQGPQTINKRGRPVAVVVSFDEWERKNKRQGTLLDFFATAPRVELELPLRRGAMREIDL